MAFDTPYPPAPKMVLLKLADYANDEGECFPAIKTLAIKTSVSPSNTKYILRVFEYLNLLKRQQRTRENDNSSSSNFYQINLNTLQKKSLYKYNFKNDPVQYKAKKDEIIDEYKTTYRLIKNQKGSYSDSGKSNLVTPAKNKIVTPIYQNSDPLESSSLNHQREKRELDKSYIDKFLEAAILTEKPRSPRAYKNKLKKSLLEESDSHHSVTIQWYLEWKALNILTPEHFINKQIRVDNELCLIKSIDFDQNEMTLLSHGNIYPAKFNDLNGLLHNIERSQ